MLHKIYSIKINNTIIDDLTWSRWKQNKYKEGLEFIIPIDSLPKGAHILSIYDESGFSYIMAEDEENENETNRVKTGGKEIIIPFWYDKLAANNK